MPRNAVDVFFDVEEELFNTSECIKESSTFHGHWHDIDDAREFLRLIDLVIEVRQIRELSHPYSVSGLLGFGS